MKAIEPRQNETQRYFLTLNDTKVIDMRLSPFLFLLIFGLQACTPSHYSPFYKLEYQQYDQEMVLRADCVQKDQHFQLRWEHPKSDYILDAQIYPHHSKSQILYTKILHFEEASPGQATQIVLGDFKPGGPPLVLKLQIASPQKKLLGTQLFYLNGPTRQVGQEIYLEHSDGRPFLGSYAKAQDVLQLASAADSIQLFCIDFFPHNQAPAPPPYSKNNNVFLGQEQKATDRFWVKKDQELRLSQEGLYWIRSSETTSQGIYLNYFGEDFPKVNRVKDLILGSRYITKNIEYDKMKNAAQPKKALDEFWLARSKKEEQVKRLIKSYYGRMEYANKSFSSYKEGWKTDRGIIYTIFGPPQLIRQTNKELHWYYGSSRGRYPIHFTFNAYEGQWILQRSGNHRTAWNAEVLNWRNALQ